MGQSNDPIVIPDFDDQKESLSIVCDEYAASLLDVLGEDPLLGEYPLF